MIKLGKIATQLSKRVARGFGHDAVAAYDWRDDPSKNPYRVTEFGSVY